MIEGKRASLRYFTGTGNSKRIAEMCAEVFAESGWATDIAAITEGELPATEAQALCFVFPVYSLDLPRIARRYLESLPPVGDRSARGAKALLLVTGGNADDCGWSLVEGRRILEEGGYDVAFADLVRMPNNWGPFMKVPGAAEAAEILAAGEEKARAAAKAFLAGGRYAKALSLPVFGPIGSRLLRSGFKRGVKKLWKMFRASEACSGCGLCAASCPTRSITMAPESGPARPRWSARCEQCMRCFNLCPNRAILQLEALGHGSKKERWIEPHLGA
jgi:ferredoxin